MMTASAAWRIEDGKSEQFAELVEIWREAWQLTRPDVDFTARLGFIEGRLADSARGQYRLRVLSRDAEGASLGFTLLEPKTALMEQIAVHPDAWGNGVADALVYDAHTLFGRRLWLTVNQFKSSNPGMIAQAQALIRHDLKMHHLVTVGVRIVTNADKFLCRHNQSSLAKVQLLIKVNLQACNCVFRKR